MVTSVNGKPVKSGSDLVDPITQTAVGNKVHLVFMRGGVQHEADAIVEDRAKLFPDRLPSYEAEQAPAQPEEDSELIKQVKAVVKEDEEMLKTSTVSDYLARLNAP